MEQVDLRGEPREVGRLLERGVAAADDGDLAVPEEEAVARRAGRHAAPAQPGLAIQPEPQRRGARGDDHGLCPVFDAPRPQPERPLREVHSIDVDVEHPRAEPLGLGTHGGHQVGALDAVDEARIVLDIACQHQLAAGRGARQHDRLEVGPGRIDRGGQAGRAGPDDDQVRLDRALGVAHSGRRARSRTTRPIRRRPRGRSRSRRTGCRRAASSRWMDRS